MSTAAHANGAALTAIELGAERHGKVGPAPAQPRRSLEKPSNAGDRGRSVAGVAAGGAHT